jgi:hypothetical protein
VAILIALGIPGGHFYFGYQRVAEVAAAEIDFKAQHVTRLITGNPNFWQYESVRIAELVQDTSSNTHREYTRVFDSQGNVVAQHPAQRPDFK